MKFTKEQFLTDKRRIKLEEKYRPLYFDLVYSDYDPRLMAQFLRELDPLLNKILNAYTGSNNPILKGRLKVLAVNAIKNYDPTKSSLTTHLYTNLKTIMEHTRHDISPIYVSSRVALNYQKIIKARDELYNKLQREPTVDELADHTGLSVRKIEQVLAKLTPVVSEGTLVTDEEGEQSSITKLLAVERPETQEKKFRAALEAVYYDASPQEKVVMSHTYGLFNKKKLPVIELAKKLGVSPGRVSQIRSDIDRRIKDYLGIVYNF